MKKQEIISGSIFKVPVYKDVHVYGRVLRFNDYAFYHYLINYDDLNLKNIISNKIIFTAIVQDFAIVKNKWQIMGFVELEEKFNELSKYQSPNLIGDSFTILENGKRRRSSKEECTGLEYALVWEYEQIEERIRNYYDGVPNKHILAYEKLIARYK